MFLDVERPFERIFYILGIQKSNLDEFAEVVFYVGEWPWEFIFCLLDVLKNDFVEVDVAKFQCLKNMSTHFLHPVHQKATRTKSLEMFYVGEWA
jgi:hypothetical protein